MATEQELNKTTPLHKEFQSLLEKDFKDRKLKDVKLAISKRNLMDKNRKLSPLQKHPDAVVVNTGKLNKQDMLAKMFNEVEKVLRKKYGKRTRTKKH